MNDQIFENFENNYIYLKNEFYEIMKKIAKKVFSHLESLVPMINFFQKNQILFTHHKVKMTTYKGLILDETSDLLLVYCGGDEIKSINKSTGEFSEDIFYILYKTMIWKFSLKKWIT